MPSYSKVQRSSKLLHRSKYSSNCLLVEECGGSSQWYNVRLEIEGSLFQDSLKALCVVSLSKTLYTLISTS